MRTLCFSQNGSDIATKLKDYMNHYLVENMGKKGYSYDKEVKFSEKEAILKTEMRAEVERLANVKFSDNTVDEALFAKHPNVQWAAMSVVESMIDMVLPDVLIKEIGLFTDFRNIKAGDSAVFHVKSNQLFEVSKVGRNKRVTEFQRQYEGTTTIVPEARALTVGANYYRTICGLDSLAELIIKAVLSFEAQIRKEVYGALNTAMTALPADVTGGELKVTGYTKSSVLKLAQRVQAYNNGLRPVFVGTKVALSNIMPTASSGYIYSDESSLMNVGYIRTPFGYDCIELEQVADWNDKYKTVINDSNIYVVCPGAGKLIQFVYEGIPEESALGFGDTADRTSGISIQKSYGFGICTNATAGIIVAG